MEAVFRALEHAHQSNRELTESAVLAALLKNKAFLVAFLNAVGCPWAPIEPVAIRCEVKMLNGKAADIEITWYRGDADYRILVENKPYAGFTSGQPGSYIDEMERGEEAHAGFVFLYSSEAILEKFIARLSRRTAGGFPTARAQSWTTLSKGLRARARPVAIFKSTQAELAAALRAVPCHDPAEVALREWLCAWHLPWCGQVSADSVRRAARFIEKAPKLQELVAKHGERVSGDFFHGWWLARSRAPSGQASLWLGVEPDTAQEIGVPDDTLLLEAIGWWSPRELSALDEVKEASRIAWSEVPNDQRGPLLVIPLHFVEQAEAIVEPVMGLVRHG